MKHLLFIDKDNVSQCMDLLREFEISVFNPSFPFVDEREPFEEIIERVKQSQNEAPVSYCVLSLNECDNVIGGMVVDWYPESNSLEIIYLAVKDNYRRQRIGSQLRYDGLDLILAKIRDTYGQSPNRVYLEVEFPMLDKEMNDNFNASDRMNIWLHWGAKVIPIRYYQPPLADRRNGVSDLILMAIPFNGELGIPKMELKNFLIEFYRGLKALDSYRLAQMLEGLGADNKLCYYDCIEESGDWTFGINEDGNKESENVTASIVWHFIYSGNSNWAEDKENCDIFNSYECDLMNYVNQNERPFKTHFIKKIKEVHIKLPAFYSYSSEGRTIYRKSINTDIVADISLSFAYSQLTDVHIVNMAISPREANENDILKLVNVFGSKQENYLSSEPIEISENGHDFMSINDFLSATVHIGKYEILDLGVSEFSGIKFNFDEAGDTSISERNKMLCGLMLGIFDFRRMNAAEIKDTVKPVVTFDDFDIYVARGHMMKINKGRYDIETAENILVSPYVLIPSEAMAFNEYYLRRGDKLAVAATKHRWIVSAAYKNIADSQHLVINGYLSNIFHYSSEKNLFNEADIQRSLTSRRDRILERIDAVRHKCECGTDTILEGVLAVIALCQISEFFAKSNEIGTTFQSLVVILILIYVIRFIRIMTVKS